MLGTVPTMRMSDSRLPPSQRLTWRSSFTADSNRCNRDAQRGWKITETAHRCVRHFKFSTLAEFNFLWRSNNFGGVEIESLSIQRTIRSRSGQYAESTPL